jgi:nucleoside-diphosphate-sugar epimerase
MKALVSGAGGFVGANLVRHLLGRGDEPVAMLRPGGNRWRLEDVAAEARVEFVDLRRPEDVARLVVEVRPDVVFNLAAYGAYSWQTDLDEMLAVNVRATEALLAGARRVDARLIQAGSSSEYGFSDRGTTELDRVEPNSHYAITKVAATHLCRLAAAQYGQHAVTLRLYSLYGPWEEPGRLMPTLVDRALDGTYPPLVAPETARDFVWIGDACDAFLRAGTTDLADRGAVLNVASGAQTTLRALVDIVRSLFDIESDPVWDSMPARRWDTSVWVGDPSKAIDLIGWTASTPLEQGLRTLTSWMQADPARRTRYSDAASTHSRNSAPSAPESRARARRRL